MAHPTDKRPLSEPGLLGLVCLLAAPVLGGVFGLTGNRLLLGLIVVFAGVVLIGLAAGILSLVRKIMRFLFRITFGALADSLRLWKLRRAARAQERQLARQLWLEQADAEKRRKVYQSEQSAARRHLAEFYDQYQDLLSPMVTPALLKAFFESHMPYSLSPHQLWQIAHQKINELQPLIARQRKKQEAEHGRLEAERQEANRRAADQDIDRRIAAVQREYEKRLKALRTLEGKVEPDFLEDLIDGETKRHRIAILNITGANELS